MRKKRKEFRDISIYLMKKFTSLSNSEIGHFFGDLTYSAVAKVYQRLEKKMINNQITQHEIEKIMKKLSTFKG